MSDTENLQEFEPYKEELREQLPKGSEPTHIETRANEIEYQFEFEDSARGQPLLMCAIWNRRLKRFYFQFQDPLQGKNIPFMNKREFLKEMSGLEEDLRYIFL